MLCLRAGVPINLAQSAMTAHTRTRMHKKVHNTRTHMHWGGNACRVASLLLPALLRAAAEVASPREMLTALLEALGEHSRFVS